ncbi:MAG: 3-keto-5-aminohexanoate cleavage protein [Bacilli bacterium]
MEKLMITTAVVGAEVTRNEQPNLPLTPDEIAIEVEKAWEAGASIAHIHGRDLAGNATQDVNVYREIIEKVKSRCDIIIQVSTGGAVGMTPTDRIAPVTLRPEMATLTTGTVNFGNDVFMNAMDTIRQFASVMKTHEVRPEFEIFDVGMIYNALQIVKEGLVEGHLHFDFVLGVPGAIPATVQHLLHMVDQLPKEATWTVAALGRHQLPLATHAICLGGNVRVGFEDNIYYTKGVLASSNADLVARVARISSELGREIATPNEARRILGINTK